MAIQVLKGAMVRFGNSSAAANTTSLTGFVRGVTLNYNVDLLDKTAMQSTFRKNIAGLRTATITLDLFGDFADNGLDEIWSCAIGSSRFCCVQPNTAAVSASNPRYKLWGFIDGYPVMSNSVGEVHSQTVTFVGSGNLARITSTV